MQTVTDPGSLQAQMRALRMQKKRIGFVPTMGFLHDGHLSLMQRARRECDHLVVSIYVNPLQFGANEDLDTYPKDHAGDAQKCVREAVDTLFLPPKLYHPDHSTTVSVAGLTEGLCGATRPGHFDGVTTVVARLFGLVQPHTAVFGEKDYQQLAVIRRMVRDLNMDIDVIGSPLIRDQDGLALSSRNKYLSPVDRARALSLHRALQVIRDHTSASARVRIDAAQADLQVDKLDYLAVVDPVSLHPLQQIKGPARTLVAGWIGNTRLIDNMAI